MTFKYSCLPTQDSRRKRSKPLGLSNIHTLRDLTFRTEDPDLEIIDLADAVRSSKSKGKTKKKQ